MVCEIVPARSRAGDCAPIAWAAHRRCRSNAQRPQTIRLRPPGRACQRCRKRSGVALQASKPAWRARPPVSHGALSAGPAPPTGPPGANRREGISLNPTPPSTEASGSWTRLIGDVAEQGCDCNQGWLAGRRALCSPMSCLPRPAPPRPHHRARAALMPQCCGGAGAMVRDRTRTLPGRRLRSLGPGRAP